MKNIDTIPSSAEWALDGNRPAGLWARGAGLFLACLGRSLIGILLLTSGPPNGPSVPCISLSAWKKDKLIVYFDRH